MKRAAHVCGAALLVQPLVWLTPIPPQQIAFVHIAIRFVIALAGLLGALFPDIDHAGSRISKDMGCLLSWVRLFTKHRGVLHTPFALAVPLWFLWVMPTVYDKIIIFSWILGYISHILLDFLTSKGIMMLYPYKKTYYSKWGIVSGGGEESLVTIGLFALNIIMVLVFYDILI